MSKNITPQRVRELARLADELTCDELQIIIGAFALDIGCGVLETMVADMPEEYAGMTSVPGVDIWENCSYIFEDIADDAAIYRVLDKYNVFPLFDVELVTQQIVAKRQPL